MSIVDVDPEHSELCELCACREAYGTFNVEGVEMWVCVYCSVYVTQTGEDSDWMIRFEG